MEWYYKTSCPPLLCISSSKLHLLKIPQIPPNSTVICGPNFQTHQPLENILQSNINSIPVRIWVWCPLPTIYIPHIYFYDCMQVCVYASNFSTALFLHMICTWTTTVKLMCRANILSCFHGFTQHIPNPLSNLLWWFTDISKRNTSFQMLWKWKCTANVFWKWHFTYSIIF